MILFISFIFIRSACDNRTVLSHINYRCIINDKVINKRGKLDMTMIKEINQLKKEKNAVIFAHYYVPDEVQEIADFTGDSFALAKMAKEVDADIIVFAGVKFMGESAKILNPDKKVLMPDMNADCPMAHMAAISKIEQMRNTYDDLVVVCYVNSTAELKVKSDVCVTSSNAVDICKALPNKNIFFIPDMHLGSYVKEKVPEKNIIINDGYCITHHSMSADIATKAKEKYPNALLLVHPECKDEVVKLADYAGSTAGIINYAKQSNQKEFIIGTELGVLYQLKKQCPDKKFYPMSDKLICENMKKVQLEKVRDCLKYETNEVILSDEVKNRALSSLERMLEYAK